MDATSPTHHLSTTLNSSSNSVNYSLHSTKSGILFNARSVANKLRDLHHARENIVSLSQKHTDTKLMVPMVCQTKVKSLPISNPTGKLVVTLRWYTFALRPTNVVPKALQRQTLQKIHTGHQGIQRCRLRAKLSIWWPGISKTINDMVKQCSTCSKHFKPRMIPTPLPDYPWQKVSSDLFQLDGAQYIVVVDYYSLNCQQLPPDKSLKF